MLKQIKKNTLYKKNNYSSQLQENTLAEIEIHTCIIEILFAEIEISHIVEIKIHTLVYACRKIKLNFNPSCFPSNDAKMLGWINVILIPL